LIPAPPLIPIATSFSLYSPPVTPQFKFTILLHWSTKHTRPLPTNSFTFSLPQSSHVDEPTLCHSTSLVCNARSFPAYAILLRFVTLYFCVSFLSLSPSAPLIHPFHFLACHRYYSPIRCPSLMSGSLVLVFVPIWTLLYLLLLPISELARSHPVSPPRFRKRHRNVSRRRRRPVHATHQTGSDAITLEVRTLPDAQTSSKTFGRVRRPSVHWQTDRSAAS
jgi:hypothetical protein